MEFPFGESVSFEALMDGVVDAHGNPTESYAAAVVVSGCGFDPGGSVESYGPGRDLVVSSPRVFVPSGAAVAVSARDRVMVRGITFEVSGDPADWVNPFTGWAPGAVVSLERVDG